MFDDDICSLFAPSNLCDNTWQFNLAFSALAFPVILLSPVLLMALDMAREWVWDRFFT